MVEIGKDLFFRSINSILEALKPAAATRSHAANSAKMCEVCGEKPVIGDGYTCSDACYERFSI